MPGTRHGIRATLDRWLPSRFLRASLWFHLVCAVIIIIHPAAWPWVVGALIVNHVLISVSGLIPRGALLGPNITRLPAAAAGRGEVAITIDDGPDPKVTPQVLDLLDQYGAHATFFCVGDLVARYPELARTIVERGHALENHSLHHFYRFSLLGPSSMLQEVRGAQQAILAVTGVEPRYFRAPAGLRNPFLEPILARLQLRLASWTRRGFDTVANDPQLVTARLLRGVGPGDILLLHDGRAATTAAGNPVILEVLPRVLHELRARGLQCVTLEAACA